MTSWISAYTTNNWKIVRECGEWHVCLLPGAEPNTVQTIKDALKVYSFSTGGFAQDCRRHMQAFDQILYKFKYGNNYISAYSSQTNKVEFRSTPLSDWKCELFGAGSSIVFNPAKDKVPNWFWRKMQYLILGNNWIKQK